MLTILTTTETEQLVSEAVATVDRLEELVSITKEVEKENLKLLSVVSDSIKVPLDWFDTEPPYVFPDIPFTKDNILALIFYKLGNQQKAFEFVSEDTELYKHLLLATHIQFGYTISAEMLAFVQRQSLHNTAVVHYYGILETSIEYDQLKNAFVEAIQNADNDEFRVYSVKHYVNVLLDAGQLKEAEDIIRKYREIAISDDAKVAIDSHLAGILMAKLQVPFDKQELEYIQELQLRCISYFESKGLHAQAGLLLIEAAEVANYKEDFIASKELINRAIQYFKQEDIPEFLGEAGLKKAILLYTWSKNGSPQYYKAAINAFQDVLKVFKRDTHPQKFADVHHNLALIYSEIPVSPEEKPMWMAFCASSFKEVLAFYTKEKYPYENAMASHNYATALMHFPPAKIHDNLEKAAGLFEEALAIRTAEKYPFERALTLLNQLELGWLTHNEDGSDERKKYEEMKSKAEEIKSLVDDTELLAKVDEHLEELEKLKSLI